MMREMSDIQHVMPRDDLIRHVADDSGDCVCGPRCEITQREAAPDLHVYVHNSLDGRENGAPIAMS